MKETLTQREKEILSLISKGYNTKEIGIYLFISPLTVKTHRQNLLKKTKSKNVAELICHSAKNGLL